MSYILDALKKADQERSLGSVPDLETPHWGIRRSVRNYRWVWVLAALLLVNGVLLSVLLGRNTEVHEPKAVAQSAGQAAGTHPLPVVPVEGAGGTVVTMPRSMTQIVQSHTKPASPSVTVPPVTRSEPRPVATTAESEVPPGVQEQPGGQSGRPGVKLWGELPLEFRSSFTMPRIDVHVYSDDPGRRFVLVDLQKYREGDTLPNGGVIEEILPQGIQVYFQGTRFQIDK